MSEKNTQKEKVEREQLRKDRKVFTWVIVAVVCVAVVIGSGFALNRSHTERAREGEIQHIAEMPTNRPSATAAPTPAPSEAAQAAPSATVKPKAPPTPKPRTANERDINFEELAAQNADVIGWVEAPGTDIDYAVLTTTDNDYYLEHDFFKNESEHGAIYMDVWNSPDFEDPVTILYGHNMKDGTMFAGLHAYEDEEFFNENRDIKIYTPDGQLNYRVVAAYKRDDDHVLSGRNLNDRSVYQDFLEEIRGNEDPGGHIDMNGVTEKDSLLALSTCVRGEDENRYVVYAVFVGPEDDPAQD